LIGVSAEARKHDYTPADESTIDTVTDIIDDPGRLVTNYARRLRRIG
jgi:hypothetical protein